MWSGSIFPICTEKTVRLLVLMKPFQNSMGYTHTKKMCRKFKRGLFFLDPEKLTFGGDFHPAATILCFQLRIHVLRTNRDVAAGIGIWKHSSGAASCPGAPWEKLPLPPPSLQFGDICRLWDLHWNVLNHPYLLEDVLTQQLCFSQGIGSPLSFHSSSGSEIDCLWAPWLGIIIALCRV